MRFFDHQHAARAETRRLLLAFAVAVILLVAAVHVALALAWVLMAAFVSVLLPVSLSFPTGFLAVNVGVSLLLVLGGWWVETSQLRAGGLRLAQRVGALDQLTREELQGMVAHELSHLREGDTRLKMQLAGMVYGLELVYNFGDNVRERGGLGTLFGLAIMVAGFSGWLAGRMLKADVSRQREFLADALAVQWTRSRDDLGGVLRKVMTQRLDGTTQRLGHCSIEHPALQHRLLVEAGAQGAWSAWLDSHPTLTQRVCRIYGRSMGPLPLAMQPDNTVYFGVSS